MRDYLQFSGLIDVRFAIPSCCLLSPLLDLVVESD